MLRDAGEGLLWQLQYHSQLYSNRSGARGEVITIPLPNYCIAIRFTALDMTFTDRFYYSIGYLEQYHTPTPISSNLLVYRYLKVPTQKQVLLATAECSNSFLRFVPLSWVFEYSVNIDVALRSDNFNYQI